MLCKCEMFSPCENVRRDKCWVREAKRLPYKGNVAIHLRRAGPWSRRKPSPQARPPLPPLRPPITPKACISSRHSRVSSSRRCPPSPSSHTKKRPPPKRRAPKRERFLLLLSKRMGKLLPTLPKLFLTKMQARLGALSEGGDGVVTYAEAPKSKAATRETLSVSLTTFPCGR